MDDVEKSSWAGARDFAAALTEARALRHPRRAMRVTLECGHLRLMPWNTSVMGIGAYAGCKLAPCAGPDGELADRMVVNMEETGTLLFEHLQGL